MEMTERLSPESMGKGFFTAIYNHRMREIPLFKFTSRFIPFNRIKLEIFRQKLHFSIFIRRWFIKDYFTKKTSAIKVKYN